MMDSPESKMGAIIELRSRFPNVLRSSLAPGVIVLKTQPGLLIAGGVGWQQPPAWEAEVRCEGMRCPPHAGARAGTKPLAVY